MADGHPLTPGELEEYETDLISFCDRELDRLGDIHGLDVLYAGGSSLLWLEGLSQRIGENGSLTAIEQVPEKVKDAQDRLPDAELISPVRLIAGDVFDPPFGPQTFDLVYSAGLFHELDVREKPASEALRGMTRLLRPGGRIATSDFVDTVPSIQVEEERFQADLARALFGHLLYGIAAPDRLVTLHEEFLSEVRWNVFAPRHIRHLDKLVLDEGGHPAFYSLPPETAAEFRARRNALRECIRCEGYIRAATLYVEGTTVR